MIFHYGHSMKKTIDFTKNLGLVPVIIQDTKTKGVLMLGFMNNEALEKTLTTKFVHFWSRTRKKLWLKGETSGNKLIVQKMYLDCDRDTLLIMAEQRGDATCHTGNKSCFVQELR